MTSFHRTVVGIVITSAAVVPGLACSWPLRFNINPRKSVTSLAKRRHADVAIGGTVCHDFDSKWCAEIELQTRCINTHVGKAAN